VEWIAPERFRGRADLPLSVVGRRQIAVTAQRISSGCKPAAVYSSPMRRCIDTARAIAIRVGLEVRPEEGLNDIDYGEWQGTTREEARQRWPDEVDCWFKTPHLVSIPHGETLATLFARSTAALSAIVRRHFGDTIVIVGHDSVNRVLLLHALDLPLSRYWHLKQEPCGVSELTFEDGSFIVRTMNETHHLAGISHEGGAD
jgi:probable phosphoglycerate mutase